eukprot:Lithocolla_globosa_v1_NODE_3326_length_1698_cov_8.685332.p2 type:complete len:184 gc:universal NODE_3326_length_1698_cov_8.685332:1498-947(-)
MVNDATEALETGKPVHGVKGFAVVSLFLYWNMVWSICVDYMHGMALGVGLKLMSLWFDSRYHKEHWYMGSELGEIDKRFLAIKPPSYVTRLPRSIKKHRKFFKAVEVKYWLLVYVPIILNGILPSDLFVHLMMFISALWILLGTRITQDDLEKANRLLVMFYFCFEKFYGVRPQCTSLGAVRG